MADAVGLSPSPRLIRVKRLQSEGYITGYSAEIDLRKLGESLTVLLDVTLEKHRMESFQWFEARLKMFKELVEFHLISN